MSRMSVEQNKITYKEILLEHIKKITRLFSVELRGGFWTEHRDEHGRIQKIYVQDSRDALCNAIYCMGSLMEHKIETFKDQIAAERANLDELKKKFLDYTKLDDEEVLGEDYYEGKEKAKYEEYKIKRTNIYKRIFTLLCKELGSRNWGEIGGAAF